MIRRLRYFAALGVCVTLVVSGTSVFADDSVDTTRGNRMIAAYFENETRKLADACLTDVASWDDWSARRPELQQQLREMLGLDPLPERTPLNPVVTARIERDDFIVENVHFQSRPHLYVTGNLYLPKKLTGKAPAILYACGHSKAIKNGISYGNKTQYQHHGIWFARNGYVCLVIDTLQLGEIEGIHHGTYRENMWWWNARGYTPASVETWNSIRAIDYLESRPEVDADRIGVTGRSGGGAYSWFLTALDDRIKATVPVAGITTLKNHVVDGCIEGHCDCMFIVNTYRWDYPQLAALTAPRPLLLANSDQDHIFPLDGVMEVYNKLRPLYASDDKLDQIGLHITHGPHQDTQVLQMYAFEWFNHYLKNVDEPISMLAEKQFEPEQLKVFDKLPSDEINTRIHETFVPAAAEPAIPSSAAEWQTQREMWMKALREKCFAGWPTDDEAEKYQSEKPRFVFDAAANGLQLKAYDFESQHDIDLRLYILLPANVQPEKLASVIFVPLDDDAWLNDFAALQTDFAEQLKDESLPPPREPYYGGLKNLISQGRGIVYVAPRGIGPTLWASQPQNHIRRRFMLLGQTLDGMRVWDVRRAMQTLRSIDGFGKAPLWLFGRGEMAAITMYASLFEPEADMLELGSLPTSHRDGPDFLNVLRFFDLPQAVAMAAQRTYVRIHDADSDDWQYPRAVADRLGWAEQLKVDKAESSAGALDSE